MFCLLKIELCVDLIAKFWLYTLHSKVSKFGTWQGFLSQVISHSHLSTEMDHGPCVLVSGTSDGASRNT